MSYSQILRRINRLIKSTINDTLDNLSKRDKDDMDEFDRDLRGEKRASESESGSRSSGGSSSAGGQRSSSSHGQSKHKEGKHKPGEKMDAFYYGVLGLTPSATEEEIKKAYRKLMSQYHPDRVATLGEDLQKAAEKKAQSINEAYHIIERRRGFK
jgi:DnaJ domain